MSFFDEYLDEGERELSQRNNVDSITFSGDTGDYTAGKEDPQRFKSLEKCLLFWNLDGHVLWGGNGPIPEDGDSPICRSEKAVLGGRLRDNIAPATRATVQALGWTGTCEDCPLGKFQGDAKPLCRQTAALYVAEPNGPLDDHLVQKIVFGSPTSVKVLKEKLASFVSHCRNAGIAHAAFVVRLSQEAKKGPKNKTYYVPNLAIKDGEVMSEEWLAGVGVLAREAYENTRKIIPSRPALQAKPSVAALPESVEVSDLF